MLSIYWIKKEACFCRFSRQQCVFHIFAHVYENPYPIWETQERKNFAQELELFWNVIFQDNTSKNNLQNCFVEIITTFRSKKCHFIFTLYYFSMFNYNMFQVQIRKLCQKKKQKKKTHQHIPVTDIRFFPSMNPSMNVQLMQTTESAIAIFASKFLDI